MNLGKAGGGAVAAALMTPRETRLWVKQETSTWSSMIVCTLNCRSRVRTAVGTFIHPDEAFVRKSITLACNRLDRAVHGKKVQRFGRRVPRMPFLEFGHDRGWHCHILIEPPYFMPREKFADTVRKCWEKSPCGSTCHFRDGDEGSAGYVTKARSKKVLEVWSDTLVVEAVILRTK